MQLNFVSRLFSGLDELVALDETGTRVADFEVLDLVDANNEIFQVILQIHQQDLKMIF